MTDAEMMELMVAGSLYSNNKQQRKQSPTYQYDLDILQLKFMS